ncbi:C1 family peptidase [Paenibacillus ferrarius]|uniref:C1 family peptidase n=1 Tax=Paenibacillus ferrarius TaxID=1469647 RepID=UPI003D266BB5
MTRQYLLKPDKLDNRDFLFKASVGEFPREVDLRSKDIMEIFNQLSLGACGLFAITQFMMYRMKQDTPSHYYFYLSQLYLYWKTRELEGTIGWDSGISLRDGLKIAQQVGVCRQSFFPYDINKFKDKPTPEAEADAANYKVKEYHRIMTVAQYKSALSEGNPVIMGIEIYDSFTGGEVERTGIVPLPDRNKESFNGYHGILGMGYKLIGNSEYMICRNSWGPVWGDKGYFYLPMDFIGRHVTDMWVAK